MQMSTITKYLKRTRMLILKQTLLFYGHFCQQNKLNGPSNLQRKKGEVKDEHPSDRAPPWTVHLDVIDL